MTDTELKTLLHLVRLWHRAANRVDDDYDGARAAQAQTWRLAAQDLFEMLVDAIGKDRAYELDAESEEEPAPDMILQAAKVYGVDDLYE